MFQKNVGEMAGRTWRNGDLASALRVRFEVPVMDDYFVSVICSADFEDSSHNVHS